MAAYHLPVSQGLCMICFLCLKGPPFPPTPRLAAPCPSDLKLNLSSEGPYRQLTLRSFPVSLHPAIVVFPPRNSVTGTFLSSVQYLAPPIIYPP